MEAIKCSRTDCKFNNNGWCTLDYIEIDENGVCKEYEPDEKKKIIEHNTRMAKLLEELGKLNIDEKQKNELAFMIVLGMKAEDGEFVLDKIARWEREGGED